LTQVYNRLHEGIETRATGANAETPEKHNVRSALLWSVER
jgi:hypothetical protein